MNVADDAILYDAETAGCASATGVICGGKGWPPPDGTLSALVDLGMSDDQLALYFWVGIECVRHYRHSEQPGTR